MNLADLLNAETLNDWMNIPRDMQMRQQADLIETLQAKVRALQNEIYAQAEEALFTAREEMRESEKVREMIQWMERELDELNYQLSKAQELQKAVAETDAKLALDPNYLTAAQKTALNEARSVANSGRIYIGKIVGRTDGVVFKATTTLDSVTGQDQGALLATHGDILIEAVNAKNKVSL